MGKVRAKTAEQKAADAVVRAAIAVSKCRNGGQSRVPGPGYIREMDDLDKAVERLEKARARRGR